MFKRIAVLVLLAALFLTLLIPFSAVGAEESDINFDEDFQLIYENDKASLYIGNNGYAGQIAVKQKDTGSIFYSSPENFADSELDNTDELRSVLILTYYDNTGSLNYINSCSAVSDGGIKALKLKNGVSYKFDFSQISVEITVEFTLDDDGTLLVTVPAEKIKEAGEIQLYSVYTMPYFMSGGMSDNGFMFVPDGCGAVINLNNGKINANEYYASVYGDDFSDFSDEQKIKKEKIYLPVYALKTDKSGIFAVIEEGAPQSGIYAGVSGKHSEYNTVKSEFLLRKKGEYSFAEGWMGKKEFDIFQESITSIDGFKTRYFFLEGTSSLSQMAKLYQNYLVENDEINKSEVKQGTLFSVAGAVLKEKSFLGFPTEQKIPLTKYSQAAEFAEWANAKRISDFAFRYLNADDLTVSGKATDKISPIGSLGGKKELSQLRESLSGMGSRVYLDIDPVTFSKGLTFGGFFSGSQTVGGAVIKGFNYKPNIFDKDTSKKSFYLLRPTMLKKSAEKLAASMKKQGIKEISLSVITDKIYSDFSKNPSERAQTAGNIRDYLTVLKDAGITVMAEKSNAEYFKYIDVLTDIPLHSSGYDLFDSDFPFYQLTVSGFIPYYSEPVNLSPDYRRELLRALAFGSGANYMLSGTADNQILDGSSLDYITCGELELWKDTILEHHALSGELSGSVTGIEMMTNDVIKTEYDDKTVLFNLSDTDYIHDAITAAPGGYIIFK